MKPTKPVHEPPPWKKENVGTTVPRQLNSRVSEMLMLKLDWVADMEGVPKREIIEKALAAHLSVLIRKHGERE